MTHREKGQANDPESFKEEQEELDKGIWRGSHPAEGSPEEKGEKDDE